MVSHTIKHDLSILPIKPINENERIVQRKLYRPAIDEFESMASQIQNKMNTYFSQLIKTLTSRQAELNSELDEILANYRRQQEKIKELEKLNKLHKEMYSHSTVKEVLDDVTVRVETELSSLKENIPICVEFEWNQKYAKEASKLGTLTHSVYPEPIPLPICISNKGILVRPDTPIMLEHSLLPKLELSPPYNT